MDKDSSYFCSCIQTITTILKKQNKNRAIGNDPVVSRVSDRWFVPHQCEATSRPFDLPTGVFGFRVLVPLPNYSWYCLSVAVKKSSRTLLRYSNVGLSSGFSLQHNSMML